MITHKLIKWLKPLKPT